MIFIGGTLAVAGLSIASAAELLRYSPYEDPGALTSGFWLGVAAVSVAAVTLAVIGGSLAIRAARGFSAFRFPGR